MKRILSFFVLASVLLASSCSLKEDFKGNESEFAQVSFTIGGPNASATRAIGDGTSVDMLHYAIYDADDVLIRELGKAVDEVTFPTQVEITLAKGQTYKIAFWAQNSTCGAYSIENGDVRNVAISYDGYNNDENRDAFFKTIEHTVTGDIALDVTLERPFAQINLGVTEEDWNDAAKAGIEVKQSKVTFNEAATGLDLFDGSVSGKAEVNYRLTNIPSESLYVDLEKDGEKEAYRYLSLSYILVNADDKALVDAVFTLDTNKEDVEVKVDNLPVQRNWRTNVIGRMLTGDITFNIDIDPIFDGEENYPDTMEEELLFAALNGGEVELTEDVEISSTLVVADDKSMVINLNGHNIINKSTSDELGEGDGIIVYGNLTIKGNGTVQGNTRAVWARGNYGAVVNIEGGNYVGAVGGGCEVIYASGNGIINIYGGTFEAKTEDQTSFAAPQYAVLNLHNNGKDGCNIKVFGGKFKNFNPSDNVSENPKKDFVEEGYSSVEVDGYYIVGKSIKNKSELNEAINNSPIVNVDQAIDNGTAALNINNNDLVLNMDENKVIAGGQGTNNYGFNLYGSNVEVNEANLDGAGFAVMSNSSLIVNSGVIAAKPGKSGRNMFYVTGNSSVVVNEGNYTFDRTSCYFVYVEAGCTCYINGGNFNKPLANSAAKDSFVNGGSAGTVIITGGTFNVNPTQWVAEGYEAVKSGSTWTVKAK